MAEYKRHQGHRQRMRERVQNYGLDSLADHEVLEYILYTTNAQRDTNEIAYNLLERFGDFASVLEASEEELCTVEGIGPTSARLLHMLPQVSRYYGRCPSTTSRPAHFSGPECRIPVYIIKLLCYNHIERYNQLWFFARRRAGEESCSGRRKI